MPSLALDPCVSCAQHREQSLVRLGLSPDKWDYLMALAGNPAHEQRRLLGEEPFVVPHHQL